MKLTLGISPCPNDTFMFDALLNGKIDCDGLAFDLVMEDVETLNRLALKKTLDVTKLSCFAYLLLQDHYRLLESGSALGKGIGPLLVASGNIDSRQFSSFQKETIAIPGEHTTANLLFSLFFPEYQNKVFLPFSEIEQAVISGKAAAGVIIHENRFTYQSKGLYCLADLGKIWETQTGSLIPLGCIGIRKSLPEPLQLKVQTLISGSINFAFANPDSPAAFVRSRAQEMDEEVIKKHIQTYVNEYSVSLGQKGKEAINKLLELAERSDLLKSVSEIKQI